MFGKTFRKMMIALLAVSGATPALASPPPWAPAHGYRNKHKDKHYEKRQEFPFPGQIDYDFGRCAQTEIGAVIGGAAGGVLGSTIGKGDGKVASTAIGTVIGILIGGSIGNTMEQQDQSCVGRLLAHVPDGKTAGFENHQGRGYILKPLDTFMKDSRTCRRYMASAEIDGRFETINGVACLDDRGRWIKQS
jgi:surface antigen